MNSFKFTKFLLPLFILYVGFQLALHYYPEWLWFNSFQLGHLWTFVVGAKLKVFIGFFAIALTWFGLNVLIAKRFTKNPNPQPRTDFNTPLPFLNQLLSELSLKSANQVQKGLPKKIAGVLTGVIVVLLSVFTGLSGVSGWEKIYLYFNQVPFNQVDPVFLKDISYFFFSLPFYEKLLGFATSLVFFTLILVGWIYFSSNVLMAIFQKSVKKSAVRVHLMLLFAVYIVTLAGQKWTSIFKLVYSPEGTVYGAGYTDLHAVLPYLNVSVAAMLGLALLIAALAFRGKLRWAGIGLVALFLLNIIGGQLVPGIVQSYIVSPNELEKELPYISQSIDYTKKAYKLDEINEQPFPAKTNLTSKDIESNQTIFNNIRLWNREPLKQTFSQLQEIRLYYEFNNIDVDRYVIDGNLQQVMLSAREIDTSQLASEAQTWINKHLIYTHGYGVCMSPVNRVTPEGLPDFYIKDVPPVSSIDLQVTRPQIYFGEQQSNYVIANTKVDEFDYPKGETNSYTNYQGKGGVQLDSFFKRLVYALKFSEMKLIFSSAINSKSRIIYDRQITTIVNELTPFIQFDQDPYLVVRDDGTLTWIMDGYMLSDKYPYSEPFRGRVNYIRNVVKVTIDAYDGSIQYYLADDSEPLIRTYANVYPDLFKEFSEMPTDIRAHIRYPKDLFTVQAYMYRTYHMNDPKVFYNKEDLWGIPVETYDDSERVMDAYHMVMKLPGESEESFVLMLPYTPTNKNNMIAWMAADTLGNMTIYKFPKEKTIYGPRQIEARMDQNTDISQSFTLWGQSGSRVIRGNLMVVPIEESLIYVEPIYLKATQSQLPELKRVVFAYGDQIKMAETLPLAINEVFSDAKLPHFSDDPNQATETDQSVDGIMNQIRSEFSRFKKAAQETNWTDFAESLKKLEYLIK